MSKILDETTVSLAEAARALPVCRSGRRLHPSTVFRWVTRGVLGPDGSRVRLEAVRLGATWITSTEAVQRFSDALTPPTESATIAPRTRGQRQRASERAAKELEAIGI